MWLIIICNLLFFYFLKKKWIRYHNISLIMIEWKDNINSDTILLSNWIVIQWEMFFFCFFQKTYFSKLKYGIEDFNWNNSFYALKERSEINLILLALESETVDDSIENEWVLLHIIKSFYIDWRNIFHPFGYEWKYSFKFFFFTKFHIGSQLGELLLILLVL